VIVETRKDMGECDDCKNESRLPMIVPWIWSRIAPAHTVGCRAKCSCCVLCQRCAERRLGRTLGVGDFQQSMAIAEAAHGAVGRFKRVGDRIREVVSR